MRALAVHELRDETFLLALQRLLDALTSRGAELGDLRAKSRRLAKVTRTDVDPEVSKLCAEFDSVKLKLQVSCSISC